MERATATATSSFTKRQGLSSRRDFNRRTTGTVIDRRVIDPLEEKIILLTQNLMPFYRRMLKDNDKISRENANTICDYIMANRRENNVGIHVIKLKIQTLVNFSRYIGTSKLLSKESDDITKHDVQMFLDRYRKDERVDPLHKWIGSYNLKLIVLLQFFKWLYDQDNPEPRSRKAPGIVAGIKRYKRKEDSIFTAEDLWSEDDDLLFLKYVNNARDRCYHMMSRDTACRPSELLNTRISQINFKTVPKGRQYASLVVNGKTGNREVVLTNSLPYLKDWLNQHPLKENGEAYLFCSLSDRNRNQKLTEEGLLQTYRHYKLSYFPNLLKKSEDEVPGYDKEHIKLLLKKPFIPYLRRHIGLTQKARQIHEAELRQYSGWSKNSMMHKRYVHWFNNHSSNAVLKAEGLISEEESGVEKLRPVFCSNCNEANTKNAKWCIKCGMILSFAGYQEALEEQKQKESEVQKLQEKYEQDMKSMREEMNQQFTHIMSMIQQNPVLANVKPEILSNKSIS